MIEFGKRDNHIHDDNEMILRKIIAHCIDDSNNVTYHITLDGKNVGGVILEINEETQHNHLEILFITQEHT